MISSFSFPYYNRFFSKNNAICLIFLKSIKNMYNFRKEKDCNPFRRSQSLNFVKIVYRIYLSMSSG